VKHLALLFAVLLVACAPEPETIGAPAATPEAPPAEAPNAGGGDPGPTEQPAAEATPDEPGEPVPGIDLSQTHGPVDWAAVKAAGVVFAFARATEGAQVVDASFAGHWSAMKEAGVVRGAYGVYLPGEDPVAQAKHLLATIRLESGVLPPAVDVATKGAPSGETAGADLRRYLDVIEKATGGKPVIRTTTEFWDANFDGGFGEYPLWIADPGADEPPLPKGWDGWTFWRHTAEGETAGVGAPVAQDTFAEPLSSLRGLALP